MSTFSIAHIPATLLGADVNTIGVICFLIIVVGGASVFAFAAMRSAWPAVACIVVVCIGLVGTIAAFAMRYEAAEARMQAIRNTYNITLTGEDFTALEWPDYEPSGVQVFGTGSTASIVDRKVTVTTATLVFDGEGFILIDGDGEELPKR